MNTSKAAPPLLCIFGPTGVGKSDLAEQVAQILPAEIINMDVGQFYVPLTIGTAKPAWQQSSIPHRLFDIIHEPRHLSVTEYRDLVLTIAASIWQQDKVPILVGGSGFYLFSLFYPPRGGTSQESHEVTGTWQDLYDLDPERASRIHPHDFYRINRALRIVHETGKRSSLYQPHFEPIAPFIITMVTRERKDLYQRINTRAQQMINAGWIDEVERLRDTPWERFLLTKKLIGYDDIIHHLNKPPALRDDTMLINTIQQKTRQYAKRQLTFERMVYKKLLQEDAFIAKTKSSIDRCNLTLSAVDLYIDQLLQHPLISPYSKGKK